MSERLRFAEAVCVGHPDRLADTIAERIVALASARDPLSIQHAPGVDRVALTRGARAACEAVAGEYVAAGELEPLRPEADWLVNGGEPSRWAAPRGTTASRARSSSRRPTAPRCRSAGDPRKVDPRGQALARQITLDRVCKGTAREATVWLAYRPGDLTPRWVEVVKVPDDEFSETSKLNFWQSASPGRIARVHRTPAGKT